MPVAIDPDQDVVTDLLKGLPAGSQGVASLDRMRAWLTQHHDEYAVVLGPNVDIMAALGICDELRTTRPTISVVLARYDVSTELLSAAMQAGAREVVNAADPGAVEASVSRAYELFAALRGPSGATQLGKIITVWSPKGGVGKTTMAVNMALALSEQGARKVCLVDMDLAFGDVAITMQLFPTHTIEQAIGAENSLDADLLSGLLTRHADSLMILAAPTHPDVRDRISPALVAAVLKTLRQTFDYIVVDTAPAFDEQTLTALDETDELVLVATLDVPTLKNVKVALETLELLQVAEGHRYLLLNRADDEVGISADRVENILGLAPAAKVATSVEIAAATNAGQPIMLKNPSHPSSFAVKTLASQLSGLDIAAPEGAAPAQASTAPRGRLWKRR